MRMAPEADDHAAVASGLRNAHVMDLSKTIGGLVGKAFGNVAGKVEIGKVVGARAMFQRDLEGGLLPYIVQRVEMPVCQPFQAQVAGLDVAGL